MVAPCSEAREGPKSIGYHCRVSPRRVKEGTGETPERAVGQGPILPAGISDGRQQRGSRFRVRRDEMQEEINAPMLQTAELLTPLTFTVHLGY